MSLHIECRAVNQYGRPYADLPIEPIGIVWSETVAVAGTSTNASPGDKACIFTLTADVDMFVAFGPAPNAAANPRSRLKAGVPRTFGISNGDKVAWSAT